MSTTELEGKCRDLHQLQSLIEEAQQEAEAIKDSIKAHLTAQGVDELRVGEYRVSWKPITTTRIDGKAFQQAFPEVAQAFTCQRRYEIVRKRRRNFVVFRRGGG